MVKVRRANHRQVIPAYVIFQNPGTQVHYKVDFISDKGTMTREIDEAGYEVKKHRRAPGTTLRCVGTSICSGPVDWIGVETDNDHDEGCTVAAVVVAACQSAEYHCGVGDEPVVRPVQILPIAGDWIPDNEIVTVPLSEE